MMQSESGIGDRHANEVDSRAVRYWVIGDIHGMLDPLQRLLDVIECHRLSDRDVYRERLIFLGDYIDYGPNSRGVLDRILAIESPYETVLLAGNHEHLMLHFLDQTEFNRRFRTPWMHGNGGGATLLSLCPEIDTPDAVLLGDAYHLTPERCAIPEKYVDFVRNLTFAHHETLPSGLQLVFLHAPPTTPDRTVGNTEVPLAEQLEADTYQHFEALVSRHQLWIEDTQLWNRRLPPVPDTPGERIMFHGHTPTHIILEDETYRPYRPKQFPGHGALPYLHTCRRTVPAYDKATRHLAMDAPLSELISVHLDTGCAYGIALTAICFTDDMLHDPVAPGFHIFRACSELMRNPRDAMQPHQVVFR